MSDELYEILDAIGGMCIQYESSGIADSTIAKQWPRHKALLLDILFRQVAVHADPESGLLEEHCVSAQECAIEVLKTAGLIEHHKRQRWWHLGERDQRPTGYYMRWAAHAGLIPLPGPPKGIVGPDDGTAKLIQASLTCPKCGEQAIDITQVQQLPRSQFICSHCGHEITAWMDPVPNTPKA